MSYAETRVLQCLCDYGKLAEKQSTNLLTERGNRKETNLARAMISADEHRFRVAVDRVWLYNIKECSVTVDNKVKRTKITKSWLS